jgi:hypothetical protein
MAEFQWWLLIVGVVAGAGLVAVVFMDGARREVDITEDERRAEANWISSSLGAQGRPIDRDAAEAVLRAHREYLGLPPPDRLMPLEPVEPVAPAEDPPESEVGRASFL